MEAASEYRVGDRVEYRLGLTSWLPGTITGIDEYDDAQGTFYRFWVLSYNGLTYKLVGVQISYGIRRPRQTL